MLARVGSEADIARRDFTFLTDSDATIEIALGDARLSLEREPAPIASLQPLAPPALDRLVRRCLAKSPDDRPDGAHDVADDHHDPGR